jgi:hypothetical protein
MDLIVLFSEDRSRENAASSQIFCRFIDHVGQQLVNFASQERFRGLPQI